MRSFLKQGILCFFTILLSLVSQSQQATDRSFMNFIGTGMNNDAGFSGMLRVAGLVNCLITGPTATCPQSIEIFNAPSGMMSYAWSITGDGAINGSANQDSVIVLSTSTCNGSYILTLTIVDENQQQFTCTKTVSVIDNTGPVLTVPADTTLQCTDPLPLKPLNINSSPNFIDGTYNIGTAVFGAPLTSTPVTADAVMVQDNGGNPYDACDSIINNLTGKIAVIERTGCTPPASFFVTKANKAQLAGAVGVIFIFNVPGDQVATMGLPPGPNPTINIPLMLVSNNYGNTLKAEILAGATNVSMSKQTVFTSNDCSSSTISFTENFVAGNCPTNFSLINTWTATDQCGNTTTASQTITVADTTGPTLTVPADTTLQCTDPLPLKPLEINSSPTFFDGTYNVGTAVFGAPLTSTPLTADAVMVQDNGGNPYDACDSIINNLTGKIAVIERTGCTPPASFFVTKANKAQLAGAVGVIFIFNQPGNQVATMGLPPGPNPTINIPLMLVSNTYGNALKAQILSGPVNVSLSAPTVFASDDCSFSTITHQQTFTPGNCPTNYTLVNTWTATDQCGNTTTASQTITVADTTGPTLTCPANITVNNTAGMCGAIVNFAATATDNCSTPTITYSKNPGTQFNIGTTTVTVTAADSCGNTITCSFTVTVNDSQNPVISCPASAVRYTNPGLCTYQVQHAEFNAMAIDNCAVTSLTYVLSGATTGSGTGTMQTLKDVLLNQGVTTVTWTAKDAANNTVSCTFTVTVNDDQNSTDYIIYAEKKVGFGEFNFIGGDVGVTAANGQARFSKNVLLDPYFIRSKNIVVNLPSSVNNRVYSPATGGPTPPFMAYSGNTTGLSNITVTVNGTLNSNWKDVRVKKGVICTITGNNFGKITIEEGANVTFTAPVINLEKMDVQKGKKQNNILTVVNYSNPTWVKVKDRVDVGDDCHVNVGGPKVTFYVGNNAGGSGNFEVNGENSQVTANIMIPKGKLDVYGGNNINRPTYMTGWYIIENLESHKKYVYWNRYDCSTPSNLSIVQQSPQPEVKPEVPAVVTTTVTQPVDEFRVNVYPNPSAYDFSIQVSSKSNEPVTVRILDMNGKVLSVHAQQTKANNIRVGDKLTGGTYIAEVIQGTNRKTLKLVKLN
ncbi:MAG: PA domain-containing protein [Ferruginibacter sp.]